MPKLQTKLAASARIAATNHTPLSVASLGHAPNTAVRLGNTT